MEHRPDNTHVIAFHGSDHKNGVTMIAQSVSQLICREYPKLSVIFLGMNGRPSCEYIQGEIHGIEDLHVHLDNRTLSAEEIKMMCHVKDNFYMMSGVRNLMEVRSFFPETAQFLIGTICGCFDVIICDTGNDTDNGLAVGALCSSGQRYFVLAQNEGSLREYEKKLWLYRKLGIRYDGVVLNKYYPRDPCDLSYVSQRLGIPKDEIRKVALTGYARQAEMQHQTLLDYRNDSYEMDIRGLAAMILKNIGVEYQQERRWKRLWKTGSI